MEISDTPKFLLVFDAGQTLCYNCDTYEEFVKRQTSAMYRIFINKFTKMTPAQLGQLGLSKLPLSIILADSLNWEHKFNLQMGNAMNKFKEDKNSKYVGEEAGIESVLMSVLLDQDVFNCGISEKSLTSEQLIKLKEFGKEVLTDDGCMVAKYECFEGCKELLAKLQNDKRFIICICTNTSYAKKQRAIITSCGLDPYFDTLIVSSEVKVRKPNPEILGIFKKKYKIFKDYQICMIGDMIDRDILCGKNANVRTAWFTQNQFDPALNYKKIKDCKPDFSFSQYAQLPAIIDAMLKDAEYLKTQVEEIQENYRKEEFYKRLPSQQRLNVGYYIGPETESTRIQKNGYFISNDKIQYYPFQPRCQFELQPKIDLLFYSKSQPDKELSDKLSLQKIRCITQPDLSDVMLKINNYLQNPSIEELNVKYQIRNTKFSVPNKIHKIGILGKSPFMLTTEKISFDLGLNEIVKNIGEKVGIDFAVFEIYADNKENVYEIKGVKSIFEEKFLIDAELTNHFIKISNKE